MSQNHLRDEVQAAARAARVAAATLRRLTTDQKNEALLAVSARLRDETGRILKENAQDVSAAVENQTPPGIIDRLTLTEDRLAAICDALETVVELRDPVGEVVRGYRLPNGLRVEQVRVPMGVVGMIYEARPNVTVDAAGLALKSGNACLLRGSSSAAATNSVLISVMREALDAVGVPADAIIAVPGTSHESVQHLMAARGLVDVLIPRGGAGLINSVVTGSQVPVIETGIGNCHVYVDASADLDRAVDIVLNAKVQRPSVCNAAETLLVHRDIAAAFYERAAPALARAGVRLHADSDTTTLVQGSGIDCEPVTDEDWAAEYYSLDLAAGVVDDIAGAIAHISNWSTGHTEAIVADSASVITEFLAGVDSAAVAVNASTRFTDGGELGFGAEIGISTQKLHARGPMALPELTTTTFIITGNGHVRA
ncbi:MAG: glutamate-5-semialdehyde dehydrogenase [Actinobacteria bacterium]|nr:glutamate-5-semialdehyde dehydrogenase [Actinomycetota bacterium]